VNVEELNLDDLRIESFPITETSDRPPWLLSTLIGGGCNQTYVGHSCNDTDTCMWSCRSCPSTTCTCPP
jgi:hypothetical protein